jgi:hypothetical protein
MAFERTRWCWGSFLTGTGILLLHVLCTGCVCIKARTIIQIEDNVQERGVLFGLKDVVCAEDGRILGRGWHPREHQTYWFFLNEPYPDMSIRWLLLVPSETDRTCDLHIWVQQKLLTNYSYRDRPNSFVHLSARKWAKQWVTAGERKPARISFKDLPLEDADSGLPYGKLSGRIVASLIDESSFERKLGWLTNEVGSALPSCPFVR